MTDSTELRDYEAAMAKRRHDHVLTDREEIIDVRGVQRTYEGAYLRTAMLEVTLALSILRLFNIEFFPIGMWFAAIALAFLVIGFRRRLLNNVAILSGRPATHFLTSGTPVLIMTVVCLAGYVAMLVEVFV
ncbi:uncharacterized protein V1510DRAFT_400723 [Dipodascopsis tothii]|uniref:uncharacterized protein n=1 Tax=Dipodascopsis tothii TaxID=44089 RepID=UPI0034CE440B